MQELEYDKPKTIAELKSMIAANPATILAGGTDLLPAMRRGKRISSLIDISSIESMKFIQENRSVIQIGATVSHADIQHSELIRSVFPALSTAASSIGCIQTRQRGTIGGNLANASPAADLAPVLLALDASVQICSSNQTRTIPLSEFWLGKKQTALQSDEFIELIEIPKPTGKYGAIFRKAGKRKGMAIAVASVALFLSLNNDNSIHTVRIAFGSLAPKPIRSKSSELVLMDQIPNQELLDKAIQHALTDISPIDDIRATASYRQHTCKILLGRTLRTIYSQLSGREI